MLVPKNNVQDERAKEGDPDIDARDTDVGTVKEVDIKVERDAETQKEQGPSRDPLLRGKIREKDYAGQYKGDGENRLESVLRQGDGEDHGNRSEDKGNEGL